MKKILVTLDGSDYSKKALKKAAKLANAYNASITLLNVRHITVPHSNFPNKSKILSIAKKNSDDVLNEGREFLADYPIQVETVSLEGDAAHAIIKYLEDKDDIDLIVMGSLGLSAGRIQKFFLGSVTNKIIHQVKEDVLVVR